MPKSVWKGSLGMDFVDEDHKKTERAPGFFV